MNNNNIENCDCYFCDEVFPNETSYIKNYNGLYVCFNCICNLPINYINQEKGECPACFENTILLQLPTCQHKLCFKCCKTIYFGYTTHPRPIHWRERTVIEEPKWPYEKNEEDENDPGRIKYDEYGDFEAKHFDFDKNTYELITIRDSLIPSRPKWMNAEEIINYENNIFKWFNDCAKAQKTLEKNWEKFTQSKTKGNGRCHVCRAPPTTDYLDNKNIICELWV